MEGEEMHLGIIARSTQRGIDAYNDVNDEVGRRLDNEPPDGCLVHIARIVDDGFEVIEVWESREKQQTFTTETLQPAMEAKGFSNDDVEWTEFECANFQAGRLGQDA